MPFLSFCTEIVSRHVGKWLIQKVFFLEVRIILDWVNLIPVIQ
jgi:hypothetical protein